MSLSIETRATLLLRIRDPQNKEAWREFIDLYHPLIAGVASKFGFQTADADELSQTVLMLLLQKQEQYRPNGQPGSFRRWLATVARNAAISQIRKRQRYHLSGGSDLDALQGLADRSDADLMKAFVLEERQQLFHWAAEQVRARSEPATWQAFWLTSVEQNSVEDVAKKLHLTPGQVYVARSRVLKRLRETVQQYSELHEELS